MTIGNTKQTSAAAPKPTYFDHNFKLEATKVLPGEYVATNRDMLLVTVLGSCVSCCLPDSAANVSGLNHFMLPDALMDSEAAATMPARYGMHAMEILINEMIKLGADRQRMEAKIFGGGNVLKGILKSNIGERNVDFVRQYLAKEGIPVMAEDVLDSYPRKLYFFSRSGRVLVKKIKEVHNRTIFERELSYRERLRRMPLDGSIELF